MTYDELADLLDDVSSDDLASLLADRSDGFVAIQVRAGARDGDAPLKVWADTSTRGACVATRRMLRQGINMVYQVQALEHGGN